MSRTPPEQQEPHALVVRLGVLTNAEYSQLSLAERELVEDETREMLAKYGPDFFVRDRDRLRAGLSICGFLHEPFVWWSPSFQREQRRNNR
jgi:hypothetical protein